MIDHAFKILVSRLGAYIKSLGGGEEDVVMGNIATVGSTTEGQQDLVNKIILTLVNIEEDATLRNTPNRQRPGVNIVTTNPPIFLNLYILVSAHYDVYHDALARLSHAIEFFHRNSILSLRNPPATEVLHETGKDETMQLRMEICPLSLEQLGHLWGSLGGRQWPSVLYKVRLLQA